jgi:ubiquinone/menaquinone biosynthesis C-methylase UbiE
MNLSLLDPTQRFSDRVDNYVKYRPTYPSAIMAYLRETIHLHRKQAIADIGSGTGIFAELFLKHGFKVTGVEPNQAMREAGEVHLRSYPRFHSQAGTAEASGLAEDSVDLVTVAQAFHWMEPKETKKEFSRILRPEGHILLVWNLRLTDTPFLKALDELKRTIGKNYDAIRQNHGQESSVKAFFDPGKYLEKSFRHAQILGLEGLIGQTLSSSYMPLEGTAGYDEMMSQLADLFERYNENGQVNMEYETKLFLQ